MTPTPCGPANSLLEGDLDLAAQQQTLTKLSIAETPEGFYVIARLLWADSKDWYLTTRRERTRPRLFKDLNRLNEFLREAYPTERVELLRNQPLPLSAEPSQAKRGPKSTKHKD
jgi:hypothetical protein